MKIGSSSGSKIWCPNFQPYQIPTLPSMETHSIDPFLSYNILKEVKKRKNNGRNEWENNSVKKEEGKIEKERKILKKYLIADVVSFSDEES